MPNKKKLAELDPNHPTLEKAAGRIREVEFARVENALTLDLGSGVTMELVMIQPGKFMMGSRASERYRLVAEVPQHPVTISNPFYLGKYQVTQSQWKAVMGDNPSYFEVRNHDFLPDCGDNCPVEQVSWDDCQEFCRRLSNRSGREIRLPTEAEWEYACRAGTTTAYSFGSNRGWLGAHAWFKENGRMRTHTVGQKQANPWGLCDMHGNVWEWCSDWFGPYSSSSQRDPTGASNGELRVVRGGSCATDPTGCRCANRGRVTTDTCLFNLGLRVASGKCHLSDENRPRICR